MNVPTDVDDAGEAADCTDHGLAGHVRADLPESDGGSDCEGFARTTDTGHRTACLSSTEER